MPDIKGTRHLCSYTVLTPGSSICHNIVNLCSVCPVLVLDWFPLLPFPISHREIYRKEKVRFEYFWLKWASVSTSRVIRRQYYCHLPLLCYQRRSLTVEISPMISTLLKYLSLTTKYVNYVSSKFSKIKALKLQEETSSALKRPS